MDKNLIEGLRWLDQAEADLKTAKDCVKDGNYYASSFFLNRLLKNVLKGFLYSKGFRALITHSVLDLVGEASKFNERFNAFMDFARELDRHYIGARYPNAYPSGAPYRYYTREVAEKCVNYVESILVEVKNCLKA
ncbi:MAG: HEPN domain-containing protein [Nitrososphaeria archaeon]